MVLLVNIFLQSCVMVAAVLSISQNHFSLFLSISRFPLGPALFFHSVKVRQFRAHVSIHRWSKTRTWLDAEGVFLADGEAVKSWLWIVASLTAASQSGGFPPRWPHVNTSTAVATALGRNYYTFYFFKSHAFDRRRQILRNCVVWIGPFQRKKGVWLYATSGTFESAHGREFLGQKNTNFSRYSHCGKWHTARQFSHVAIRKQNRYIEIPRKRMRSARELTEGGAPSGAL